MARLSTAENIVLLEDGDATNLRGKVAKGLLAQLGEVAAALHIEGLILISWNNRGTTVSFSGSIPEQYHQRLRNVWFAYPEGRRTIR